MKKLLVLDLDETLIHATKEVVESYDFKVGDFFVNKRSHLDEFLSFCNENFDIVVWTSSTKNYADKIIDNIFPDNHLSLLLTREDCVQFRDISKDEIVWIKDLKKLKRRGHSLDNIVVVDDSPEKLQRNYGNLIQVKPFFSGEDDELLLLKEYLKQIINEENIRNIEKRNWKNKMKVKLL